MRGRYGDGVSTGIYIPGLNLHHTFTLQTWIYAYTNSGTIFSKDKGGYAFEHAENLLDLEIIHGAISAKLYTNATDHFNGNCKTEDDVVKTETWLNVAYVFLFDGMDTKVDIYVNTQLIKSFNGVGLFLEDKDVHPNAWLMVSSSKPSGSIIPTNAFHGYMYRFRIINSIDVANIFDDVDEIANCSNCEHVNPVVTN